MNSGRSLYPFDALLEIFIKNLDDSVCFVSSWGNHSPFCIHVRRMAGENTWNSERVLNIDPDHMLSGDLVRGSDIEGIHLLEEICGSLSKHYDHYLDCKYHSLDLQNCCMRNVT